MCSVCSSSTTPCSPFLPFNRDIYYSGLLPLIFSYLPKTARPSSASLTSLFLILEFVYF